MKALLLIILMLTSSTIYANDLTQKENLNNCKCKQRFVMVQENGKRVCKKMYSKCFGKCNEKTSCICKIKTPEQVIRENKLSRDERKDTWIQDVNQPGRWWYGYYVTDKNGIRFIARFTYVSAMNDFRSLYPTNYKLYQKSLPTVHVNYKGY